MTQYFVVNFDGAIYYQYIKAMSILLKVIGSSCFFCEFPNIKVSLLMDPKVSIDGFRFGLNHSAESVVFNTVCNFFLIITGGDILFFRMDPDLEQLLLKSVQQSQQSGSQDDIGLVLEPNMVEKLQRSLRDSVQRQEMLGKPAILLVSGPLRPVLARFASYGVERLHVLSYQEVPDNKQITIVASVGQ